MNNPHLVDQHNESNISRPRRETDNRLLAKWGYDIGAPTEIVEMAQLSLFLVTIRAGEAVVHLGYADSETVERYLIERPANTPLLEYLAQRIDGLRPEIQRILALQNGMPFYRHLGPAHRCLQDKAVAKACEKLEATLIATPTGEPCLVFTEHDNARRYSSTGRQEKNVDPIRNYLGRTPILAVGTRNTITSRLNIEYALTGELEQTHITPSSATTEIQKRIIQMLEEAIHKKSSNIAIQPDGIGMTTVRMRIHGAMVPLSSASAIPPEIATEIANTLHNWSNATYTGKKDRVQGQLQGPADGQFTFRTSDGETFFRASFTLPDNLGGSKLESISLRLLPRDQLNIRLSDLRIKPDVLTVIDDAMREQRGIVLLVGSTSSGKSTTIHGALDHYQNINLNTKNCMSLEDPVERLVPGLVAHSINRDYGFDLMMGAVLRQDPDLIFIGEMRDRSSASTGIRAANSGHLVLSTIHADDSFLAIGALRAYISNRTVDNSSAVMVSDFDMIASINLIIAQQLVPELCPHCRQPTSTEQQQSFGARIIRYAEKHGIIPPALDKHTEARKQIIHEIATALKASYQPKSGGCPECKNAGFIGQLPINEYFAPDARCKQLLIDMLAANRLNFEQIKPYRGQTLFQAALERVRDGETTLDALYV